MTEPPAPGRSAAEQECRAWETLYDTLTGTLAQVRAERDTLHTCLQEAWRAENRNRAERDQAQAEAARLLVIIRDFYEAIHRLHPLPEEQWTEAREPGQQLYHALKAARQALDGGEG